MKAAGLKTQSSRVTLCSRTSCSKCKSNKVSFSPFCSQNLLWTDGKSVFLLLFMCILFPKFFCMIQTCINTLCYLPCPERSLAKDGNKRRPLRKWEMLSLSDTLKLHPSTCTRAGGTCDLFLINRIWQTWWYVTLLIWLCYMANVMGCHSYGYVM